MLKNSTPAEFEPMLEEHEELLELEEDTITPPSIIKIDDDHFNVANDGSTFAMSNDVIDAPFAIALDRKHLSALSMQLMDVSLAAMDKRLYKLRADFHADKTYDTDTSNHTEEAKANRNYRVETARSELKRQFRDDDSRTIRLTNTHIASILNAKYNSTTNLNTTHTANAIRSLIDVKFTLKRYDDEDKLYYYEDINVFEKVVIGAKSTKDAFLVFSLPFLMHNLHPGDYTRFSLAHHYKLKNVYAARMYKFLVSRAKRSRWRSSPEHVFYVQFSVSNWRSYLDLSEKVKIKLGDRTELEAFMTKKGLAKNESTVLIESATDLLSSDLLSTSKFKELETEQQASVLVGKKLLLTNLGINDEGDNENIQEKLAHQCVLVYRSQPYPQMAKLKKEIFEKSIMDNINAFSEGGIKITSMNFVKKGRNITSIKINYMIDPVILGSQYNFSDTDELPTPEEALEEIPFSGWVEGDISL
ncbi:replication initiation protein [Photobacterium damselae subsp. damselae]|uniref:RepB family plasmid replication initiator protein n=1 Tax=Photobacterium damselae TaxID=38293 RepID=UPI001593A3F2|nr:RepB family plasmid replication initiator protein [Photobacterium damselae]NVH52947.1 replication initiation protein [Photobacterium damselae subsp. damselae]NVO80714.1 replication initiation protein [Photobacterium damselae subsp. damselae]